MGGKTDMSQNEDEISEMTEYEDDFEPNENEAEPNEEDVELGSEEQDEDPSEGAGSEYATEDEVDAIDIKLPPKAFGGEPEEMYDELGENEHFEDEAIMDGFEELDESEESAVETPQPHKSRRPDPPKTKFASSFPDKHRKSQQSQSKDHADRRRKESSFNNNRRKTPTPSSSSSSSPRSSPFSQSEFREHPTTTTKRESPPSREPAVPRVVIDNDSLLELLADPKKLKRKEDIITPAPVASFDGLLNDDHNVHLDHNNAEKSASHPGMDHIKDLLSLDKDRRSPSKGDSGRRKEHRQTDHGKERPSRPSSAASQRSNRSDARSQVSRSSTGSKGSRNERDDGSQSGRSDRSISSKRSDVSHGSHQSSVSGRSGSSRHSGSSLGSQGSKISKKSQKSQRSGKSEDSGLSEASEDVEWKKRKQRHKVRGDEFRKQVLEEEKKEKRELIFNFYIMEQNGVPLSKKWSMDDDIDEMRFEYHKLKSENDVKDKVRLGWNLFTCVNTLGELVNNKLDPFNVSLDGWTNELDKSRDQYEPVLRKFYKGMALRFYVKPGYQLAIMYGSQFMLFLVPRLLSKVKKSNAIEPATNPYPQPWEKDTPSQVAAPKSANNEPVSDMVKQMREQLVHYEEVMRKQELIINTQIKTLGHMNRSNKSSEYHIPSVSVDDGNGSSHSSRSSSRSSHRSRSSSRSESRSSSRLDMLPVRDPAVAVAPLGVPITQPKPRVAVRKTDVDLSGLGLGDDDERDIGFVERYMDKSDTGDLKAFAPIVSMIDKFKEKPKQQELDMKMFDAPPETPEGMEEFVMQYIKTENQSNSDKSEGSEKDSSDLYQDAPEPIAPTLEIPVGATRIQSTTKKSQTTILLD